MSITIKHGKDCHKSEHRPDGGGYLHMPDDDSPYDVDGQMYCGRCHYAIDSPDAIVDTMTSFSMNITDSWAQQSRSHGDDNNQSIAKTTVWNKGECFYISTINRESSAAISPPMRYNETIAWECDRSGSVRGVIVGMDEAPSGSLKTHQRIVQQLFDYGEVRIDEETTESN